jgi:hypothetical protein
MVKTALLIFILRNCDGLGFLFSASVHIRIAISVMSQTVFEAIYYKIYLLSNHIIHHDTYV